MKLLTFGFFAMVSIALAGEVSDRLVDAAYHDDMESVRALVEPTPSPPPPGLDKP